MTTDKTRSEKLRYPRKLQEPCYLKSKKFIYDINSVQLNKDSNSEDQGPRIFESRRFPKGEFVGNMNVKKVNSDAIENKQIFSLEYGGFVE